MNILAFDTSTQASSVALSLQEKIKTVSLTTKGHSSDSILELIHALLSEAQISLSHIDVIGFGRGPGSFTGLRIAAALAQGLACAYDIPIVPVSTLQTLAQTAYTNFQQENVAVAMDARMDQIYWGIFKLNPQGIMEALTSEAVIYPQVAQLENRSWVGVGTGWTEKLAFLQPFLSYCDPQALPEASTLAYLTQCYHAQKLSLPAEKALPIYLRDKVC